MKRHVTCALTAGLLAGVLFLMSLLSAPAEIFAADLVTAPKKIISVVMDDSGTMEESVTGSDDGPTRWEAASYALQAFASLLNSQDEMYITYMDPVSEIVEEAKAGTIDAGEVKELADAVTQKVDLSEKQQAVDDIRSHQGKDNTPLLSVQAAVDKLTSIEDETDPNTQFWLVIITDGMMQRNYTNYASDSAYSNGGKDNNGLQAMLDDYYDLTMSNGTPIHYTYLGIGADSIEIDDHGNAEGRFLAVNRTTDITGSMQDLANQISGRLPYGAGEITVSGNALTVHSDIPLYSLCAFTQNSDAKVAGAEAENEDGAAADLTVEDNVSIASPDTWGERNGRDVLTFSPIAFYGNTAVITNGDQEIPAGDYTITFDKEVSLDNTVILYQPAIGLKVVVAKDGSEVSDLQTLAIDDKVDIQIAPIDPGTGEELKESLIPEGTTWSIEYLLDGSSVDRTDGRTLKGVTLGKGTNTIVPTMTIPGMVPVSVPLEFVLDETLPTPEPTPPPVLDVTAESTDPTYKRSDMGRNAADEPNTAIITGDGEKLSKAELEALGDVTLKVTDTQVEPEYGDGVTGFLNKLFSHTHAPTGVSLDDDGTFFIYPKNADLIPFLITPGRYTVTVALSSDPAKTAVVMYEVTGELSDFGMLLPWVIFILLLLYLIYILFIKHKFNGQKVTIDHIKRQGSFGAGTLIKGDRRTLRLSKFERNPLKFLDPRPSRAALPRVGVTVHTDGSGGVYITAKGLKKYDRYGSTTINPEKNFDGVVHALKPSKGNKAPAVPDREYIGGAAYYVYRENNHDLYRIRIEQ